MAGYVKKTKRCKPTIDEHAPASSYDETRDSSRGDRLRHRQCRRHRRRVLREREKDRQPFRHLGRRRKAMVRNYSRTPTFEPPRIFLQARPPAVSILALASRSRSARDQMACRKE